MITPTGAIISNPRKGAEMTQSKRYKHKRQAATPKGFLRRVKDAVFGRIDDPRQAAKVKHPLEMVLNLAVMAVASGARSTRAVEHRSVGLQAGIRDEIGCEGRIADNTFGGLMGRLDWCQLRRALHRSVKAEWRRRNLEPDRLPDSTVAIDGKHIATIPENRLRGLIDTHTPLEAQKLNFDQLQRVYGTQFPYVQLQKDNTGDIYGLVRVHRAVLVSSNAAVTVDQFPIRGKAGEWTTIEATLSALWSAYGRTKMVEMVTLDSGNASPEAARWLRDPSRQVEYFMAVKQPQGQLREVAKRHLSARKPTDSDYQTMVRQRGADIYYTVYSEQLRCDCGFKDARQVFRIDRRVVRDNEETTGTRYFVTSRGADKLDAKTAKRIAQAHWRCENNSHWTADALFDEDATRTPWTQHPEGLLSVGLLRAMAINILAVLRVLSRIRRGNKLVTPAWQVVINHAFQVLFEPFLETEAFDTFE